MPVTKRDYYEILGVAKGAALEEIKRAYRQLAMKHHPDRVPAEQKKEAEEKFKEISEAYAVLSDPQKRSVYDQYGHAGFDQRYSTEDIFRGADFSGIFQDLGFGGSIFEELFGGFGGARGGRRSARGSDLELELPISFEEAAKGVTKAITVPRRELCQDCRGEGGDRVGCATCHGTGQISQSAGFMVIARTCHRCEGQGGVIKKACPKCRGEGRTTEERRIHVKVPPGVDSGMRLRLSGEGESGTRGRGDLYVHLRVNPHPVFHRDGPHLIMEYLVDIAQATLGAEVDVPSLNGRVSLKIPPGTQSDTVFRVRGKGLADVQSGRSGDLLVQVKVETPTNLNGAQRRLVEELARSLGEEVHPARRSFRAKLAGMLRR